MIPYQQHHPYSHQHQLNYQQHHSQPFQMDQVSVNPPSLHALYNQNVQTPLQSPQEQTNTVNIQSLDSMTSRVHQQTQHHQDQQVPQPQHPLNSQHAQHHQLRPSHAQAYESQPMLQHHQLHQQQLNDQRHAQHLQQQQYNMHPQSLPHSSDSSQPLGYDSSHVQHHQQPPHYAQYPDQLQHTQSNLNRYQYQQPQQQLHTHQSQASLQPHLNPQHDFHEQYNHNAFYPQYVQRQLHQQSYNSPQPCYDQSSESSTLPPSTSSVAPMNSTSNGYQPPPEHTSEAKIESPKKRTARKGPGTRKKRTTKETNEGQRKSGYAQFFSDKQKEIKSRYPTIGSQFGEISKIVSAEWSSLSDEDRKMYNKGVTEKRRESLSKKAAEQAKKLQSDLLS